MTCRFASTVTLSGPCPAAYSPSRPRTYVSEPPTRPGNIVISAKPSRITAQRYAASPMKKAFITGISGQDGSYLAELLLEKGYEVHGLVRRASTFNTTRIDHLYQDPHDPTTRLFLHYGDLTDGSRLVTLLEKIHPDEVYNLA